jgi:hypothetical protein
MTAAVNAIGGSVIRGVAALRSAGPLIPAMRADPSAHEWSDRGVQSAPEENASAAGRLLQNE